MKKSILNRLRERDKHCWHCGTTMNLVPHHRKNRGMGGSKLLDHYGNLILVCSQYNFAMESDPDVAMESRAWGHKLRSTDHFSEPVLDRTNYSWYELLADGTKREIQNAANQGRTLL